MKLIKLCNLIIEICLLLIIGLIPIFFQCYTYRCWEINDLALLQILVEIAVLFWLIKVIFGQQPIKLQIKILLPLILFFIALILATLLSDSPQYSFLGLYSRKMGLITWLHFFLFFLVFISEIKTEQQIKRILIVILIDSAIVCLYGLAQIFGLDPFKWNPADTPFITRRIFSTFGQPNFLGSWLLFVIPLAIYSFFYFGQINSFRDIRNLFKFVIRRKIKTDKSFIQTFYLQFFIGLLIFFLFLCLILTLSRGAWVGFLAEIIFSIFVFLWLKQKKRALIIFGLFLIIFSIFYLYLNLKKPPEKLSTSPILHRLESLIFLKKLGTGYTRLICWQTALNLIKQRPIFGYGPEMMTFYSIKYYQPHWAVYEAINAYPDRAHNDILDTLFISGFFGLITYLWFIGTIFYYGLKNLKQSLSNIQHPTSSIQHRASSIQYPVSSIEYPVLIGLFGYLISLQFSFHDIQTMVYFWLYLGLIYIFSNSEFRISKQIQNSEQILNSKFKISNIKIILIILLILVTSFFIWQFSLKMVLADFYYRKVYLAIKEQKSDQFLSSFAKVFNLQPEESHYRQMFAQSLFQTANSMPGNKKEEKIKFLDLAIEAINDINEHERNLNTMINLGEILSLRAKITQQEEDFQKAEMTWQKSSNFSPNLANIYNHWCQLKIDEKKWNEALEKCQKALSLYPDLNHPHLNDIHRQQIIAEMIQVYEKLGQIYFQNKDYQKAEENYWKILHLDPFQYHLYKKIADIYYLRRDIDSAIKYNLHGYLLNPKDYNWPFVIALLYYEKKDFKMAKEYGQKALELAPEDQELKNFLESLK